MEMLEIEDIDHFKFTIGNSPEGRFLRILNSDLDDTHVAVDLNEEQVSQVRDYMTLWLFEYKQR